MDEIRVLVTEATSQVAYQLLYLLANGDILLQRKISLILVDRGKFHDELEGLLYELQDCCFGNLVSITISCNFCDVFSSADLAIILPSLTHGHSGYSDVEVSYNFLESRDFPCLEGAVHKSVRRKDCLTLKARGPMSKAMAIGNYIREAYQNSIQVVKLPKVEVTAFPQLSSIQIYGSAGLDLYDELILPKIYPTALHNLQQNFSNLELNTAGTDISDTGSKDQLYERLPSSEQSDQVMLVFALEHYEDDTNEIIEREQKELWSRL